MLATVNALIRFLILLCCAVHGMADSNNNGKNENIGLGDTRIQYGTGWTFHDAGKGQPNFQSTSTGNSQVTLTFNGTAVSVNAYRFPEGANFTITIDGNLLKTDSMLSDNFTPASIFSQSNLEGNRTHTLVMTMLPPTAEALAQADILNAGKKNHFDVGINLTGFVVTPPDDDDNHQGSCHGQSCSSSASSANPTAIASSYSQTSPSKDTSSSRNFIIIGATLGPLAALVLLTNAYILYRRYKRKKQQKQQADDEDFLQRIAEKTASVNHMHSGENSPRDARGFTIVHPSMGGPTAGPEENQYRATSWHTTGPTWQRESEI